MFFFQEIKYNHKYVNGKGYVYNLWLYVYIDNKKSYFILKNQLKNLTIIPTGVDNVFFQCSKIKNRNREITHPPSLLIIENFKLYNSLQKLYHIQINYINR